MQNKFSRRGRVDRHDVKESVRGGIIVAAVISAVAPYLPELANIGINLLVGTVTAANPLVGGAVIIVLRLVLALSEDADGNIPYVSDAVRWLNGYLKHAGLTLKATVQRILNGLASKK